MTDDGTGGMTGRFLPEDHDTMDAQRLAEVLERVESGRAPDLDPTDDPALSQLLITAMRIRSELGTIQDDHAFSSFRSRSRSAILHSLERPSNVVPFSRHSRILAPFAAAAAAAAIALTAFVPSMLSDRTSEPAASATNFTPRTTIEELDRLAIAIADIQERAQSGQSVPAPLLRAVSEGTARVANLIEQSPERVSKETVTTYIQAAQNSQTVLDALSTQTVDQDAHGALAVAQRATRDGVVVAARFLNPTGTTPATNTATPPANPSAATSGGTTTPATPGTAPATPAASSATTPGAPPPVGGSAVTPKPAPAADPDSDIVR